MARTTATNFTGPLQFPYATAATDIFLKGDIQTLALAVDGHDHSSGKGLPLVAAAIPTGLITSAMIADGTIQSGDLASGLTLSGATGVSGALTVSGNMSSLGGSLTLGTASGNQGQLLLLHPNGHISHIRGGPSGHEFTNNANSAVIVNLDDTGNMVTTGNLTLNTAVNTLISFGDYTMQAVGSTTVQTNGHLCLGIAPNGYCLVLPNIANGNGQGYANAWVTYSSIDHARQYGLNVTAIDDPMAAVEAIHGYHYDHISFDAEGNPIPASAGGYESSPMYGFAASEVQPVLPEMVAHDPDGTPSGVDLDRMVVILWEAVRQLNTRVGSLGA